MSRSARARRTRAKTRRARVARALASCSFGLLTAGCGGSESLTATLDRLIEKRGLASISVGVVQGGALKHAVARGYADVANKRPATSDTIYGLASCSKPVVGLAAAILTVEQPAFDLDADINNWLDWDPPLAHPDYPDAPVTTRMLLAHTAGIVSDGPADYETYPKPDPDIALEPFLAPLLADASYWRDEPGASYGYSNLGSALAGLVIERASGVEFREFCETRIFDPVGMPDTRWFYGDLSPEQQARHAVPHDERGEAYDVYAFNDYPSGLLRTTVPDFARLMIALSTGGRLEGRQVLPAAAVERFHDGALSIEHYVEGTVDGYEHSGGEAGVSTYFTYRGDGVGYLFLINTDLPGKQLERVEADLKAALRRRAGLR